MQFWLSRIVKGFVQYLGVVFASIPAGIVYVVCFGITGRQNPSLVIALSVGLVSAHLAWKTLDRRTTVGRPRPFKVTRLETVAIASNTFVFDSGMRLVAASIAL